MICSTISLLQSNYIKLIGNGIKTNNLNNVYTSNTKWIEKKLFFHISGIKPKLVLTSGNLLGSTI